MASEKKKGENGDANSENAQNVSKPSGVRKPASKKTPLKKLTHIGSKTMDFSRVVTQTTKEKIGKGSGDLSTNPDIVQHAEKLHQTERNLKQIVRTAKKLQLATKAEKDELHGVVDSMLTLGSGEDQPLGATCLAIAGALSDICHLLEEQEQKLTWEFEGPINEFCRGHINESIALKAKYDKLRLQYDADHTGKKKTDKKHEKPGKKKVELEERLVDVERKTLSQFEKVSARKQFDILEVMVNFIETQFDFYKKAMEAVEAIQPDIKLAAEAIKKNRASFDNFVPSKPAVSTIRRRQEDSPTPPTGEDTQSTSTAAPTAQFAFTVAVSEGSTPSSNLPLKTSSENAKAAPADALDTRVFGTALSKELDRYHPRPAVPPFIDRAISYFISQGLKEEGLFRISASVNDVEELRSKIDSGQEYELGTIDVHVVATLFKRYFRDLPEPLVPSDVQTRILNVTSISEAEVQHEYLQALLMHLPPDNLNLLHRLIHFLHSMAENEEKNKMSSLNLATIFGPNLLQQNAGAGLGKIIQVTQIIIVHASEIFVDPNEAIQPYETKSLYDYSPTGDKQLALRVGDRVVVFSSWDDEWSYGECNGKLGLVPLSYLVEIK